MKDTGVHDFVDVWFDFFLDMKPDQATLNKNKVLKRDIQTIFPLFKDQVIGYEDGCQASIYTQRIHSRDDTMVVTNNTHFLQLAWTSFRGPLTIKVNSWL